ncbi:MAG: DNA methyltransferase, partial [Promethearchaeota archaeon]
TIVALESPHCLPAALDDVLLVLGDSFDVLPCLKDKLQKKLKLIYIDPPFFTGTNEIIVIPIGLPEKDGFQLDTYFDYPVEDLAYNNILNNPNPIKFFMQWFKKRVLLMKSLLRDDGHIFVRFDYHYGHYARKVLDEVFGLHNFVNEFLVRRMKKNLSLKQAYNQTHLIVHSDSIFVYQSSKKARLNPIAIKKRKRKSQDLIERQYSNDNLWIDVAGYEKVKKTLYPTENSETLLSRIIKMSTEKGDLIADFFAGSGTTLAVAEKLKRNWVGVDIGHYSIHEIKKRLLRIPNYNPFNILSSQHLDQTSSPVARFDIDVDNKKLKVTIVDFVLDKPLPRRRTQNYIDYIDYWAIDWDYQNALFEPKWYSCREMRGKKVLSNIQSSITYEYSNPGKYLVTIAIYDVFGKSIRQSFPINIK